MMIRNFWRRRFLRIARSIAEEWEAMFSGHFVPYHKLGFIVALVVLAFFSSAVSHDTVYEAPVAVIDLDQSRWSAEAIEKLNASAYISIRRVSHSPADARAYTRHDAVQAVIHIPKGAQAELLRGGRPVTIGVLFDDSNTAQNGELTGQLSEIAAELGAEIAVSRSDGVSSLGKNASETMAMMSPLRVAHRYLTNPTGQGSAGTTIGFLFFFSLMYHGLSSLMIIGRLRVTHVWEGQVMSGTLAAFLARAVPYAFIYTVAVTAAVSILVVFGQLRFAGNVFLFVPALFLCAMANTWLAFLLSWGSRNPGDGASVMIFLVPPGFILGGATMAVGFVHGWVHMASYGIPLVWIFNFWRDIGLRGLGWSEMAGFFGLFLAYLTFLAVLVGIRFWREEARLRAERAQHWKDLREVRSLEHQMAEQGRAAAGTLGASKAAG